MNLKQTLTLVVFSCVAMGAHGATYYIDYAGGSDANNGTSKTAPWKRAPGMKGFARAYQNVPGDRFIFKGGVTWPVDCFQMKITAGGSSDSTRNYYGADPTWYAGGAFTRPLFDFQHTLVGPGWTAAAGVLIEGCSYITFENIELARHRTPPQMNGIITWGSATICLSNCSGFTLTKCVIRDWDMATPIVLGTSGGGGILRVNGGGNNTVTHCVFHQEGVPVRTGTSIWNINTVAYSEIHNTATAIMSAQLVHHNHIHHLEDPTDRDAHTNVMLCNGGLRAYNNLIHDISQFAQIIFVAPGYYGTSAQDWIYNNVIYNVHQPCIAIDTDGQNGLGSGSHIFNNTLVGATGWGACIRVGYRANGALSLLETRNNHYITRSAPVFKDDPSRMWGNVTTSLDGPNVTQTPEQATATGYVVANAFQPIDASRPTVNMGTSLPTIFTTDIRDLARGQFGAWDVGAYEFAGGTPTGTPGVLVQDVAKVSVDETAGSISLTVRRTGGTSGAISCSYSTANGTATAGVNYTAASGTLSWASGEAATKTITIAIRNVSMVGSKDFAVNLSSPAGGATLGSPASTLITIVASGTPVGTTPIQALINPSFESGLSGWTSSGNVSWVGSALYKASHGSFLGAFNTGQSTPNGFLSQSFSTVAGQSYGLSFDFGVLSYNNLEQRLQVIVRGNGVVLSRTVSLFGAGSGSIKWSPQTLTFVADGPTTTLTFQDVSPSTMSLDGLLDNVQVTGTAPPPVQDSPPTITTQPTDLTLTAGSTATFSVAATGTGALSYQWKFNGGPISGATGSSYIINSVQPAHGGSYTVVVSNSAGAATSSAATLTVTTPVQEPASLVQNGSFESGYTGWTWSGNQAIGWLPYQPTDGAKLVFFNGGQTPANGVLSQSFSTVAGRTYALDFDAGVLAYNYLEQRMQVTVRGSGVLLSRTISVYGKGGGSSAWVPQSFKFTADSGMATLTFQDVSPNTMSLDLLLDNVSVTGTGVSSEPPIPAPVIGPQPADITVTAGSPASFNVVVSGAGTLTYQWRFNGSPISGATASTYLINSVQSAQAGSYDVVVSNGSSSTTSSAAVLTVTNPVTLNGFLNGSFESGYTSWTSSGNQMLTSSQWYPGAEGNYVVAFNAGDKTPNAALSQTFATTPGQNYTLSCKVGVLAYNYNEQRMQITLQGTGTLLSRTVSVWGAGGGSTRWASQSFTFVADSPSTTLTFRDVSPSTASLDLILDKVGIGTGN
ncbi:MAG: immunoglobulin domain-containing protein [Verrucomicrobiia bacterium]